MNRLRAWAHLAVVGQERYSLDDTIRLFLLALALD